MGIDTREVSEGHGRMMISLDTSSMSATSHRLGRTLPDDTHRLTALRQAAQLGWDAYDASQYTAVESRSDSVTLWAGIDADVDQIAAALAVEASRPGLVM